MGYPQALQPDQKQAMIAHGTWGAFVAEREELKGKGVSGYKATKQLLDKYMPKPGQEPLPGAGKIPVYTNRKKNKEAYEEAVKGVVRSDVGADLHAPGEFDADGKVKAGKVDGAAPGDFDGGEMGNIGGGPVVDAVEVEGLGGDPEGVEEFEGLKGAMKAEAQLRWVIAHIDDPRVTLAQHAPHPMAWTVLSTCRKSVTFKEKFLLTILPKLLPRNVGEEKGVEEGYDGDDLVDALGEVQRSADKAKGKVGS
jgi:hypothetical protein